MPDAISEPPTLEDIRAEGIRLAEAARSTGLPLKLMGGVAVCARCPSALDGPLARRPADIDFVSLARLRPDIVRFFEGEGYAADKLFNALHGAARLNFADPLRRRPIDVILDRFVMCHTIDLTDRLATDELTMPLADLLLTKLQIVEINEKDIGDILAMLVDHPIGRGDGDEIDLSRIESITRDDWGFEHTIRRTVALVGGRASEFGLSDERASRVRGRMDEIIRALGTARKGLKWNMRAMVGERLRWYELPEEVRR